MSSPTGPEAAERSTGIVAHFKFDISKLERLNDPDRFETLRPGVMWEALGSPSPSVIVDIGAGTGLFAAKFAELAPEAVVYAADTEPKMVEWMRENRPEVQSGRLMPILSEESRVPLPDGVAGLVTMINLHHELAEKPATYSEALRLLAPGGLLLVVDWAPRETPKGPPAGVRASASEVLDMLGSVGLEDACEHHGLPWHWLIVARKPR